MKNCVLTPFLNISHSQVTGVYTVKKLGKNGLWNAVSLIDENGSFRGEAKFETKKEAERYMVDYIRRLKNPSSAVVDGKPAIKVFNEGSKKPNQRSSEDD